MSNPPALTVRAALDLHRARAEQRPEPFLHAIVADEIQERLSEVKKSFTSTLVVGRSSAAPLSVLPSPVLIDDTARLDVEPATHDLVVHTMGLHWADDPVGQIVQCRLALKPDGLFLGAMLGGQTLNELRTALAEAESRLTGGLSPRIAPMADVRDLGQLIGRAGLALPVADTLKLSVTYATLKDLVRDLRGMGESNALAMRNRSTPSRDLFPLTEEIYRHHFSTDGRLLATFEVIFLTGWAPHDSQQKPLRPGSARQRLSDALGVPEIQSGDTAVPKTD